MRTYKLDLNILIINYRPSFYITYERYVTEIQLGTIYKYNYNYNK